VLIELASEVNLSIKKEVSAGGVVVRRVNGGLQVALISVRHGKRWGLPKGRQEAGETFAQTALREVQEETGLICAILTGLGAVDFDFHFKNGATISKRHKTVHYFLMESIGGDIADYERAEVDECRWFCLEEAMAQLSFDDEKGLIRDSEKYLNS